MKGQDFGISGKKATINAATVKSKHSTPVAQKKTSVTSPIKKPAVQATPKKAPEPKVQKLVIVEKQPQVPKPPIEIVVEEKVSLPPAPPPPPTKRPIRIRYSHYKEQFEATDNYLPFDQIDGKYCISFVFKGQFIPKLKDPKSGFYANKHRDGWLVEGDEYLLEVDEDQVEEARYQRKAYKAEDSQKCECPLKQNKRMDELTKELKGLTNEELREKGEKYRELIQQRDLEDILYK